MAGTTDQGGTDEVTDASATETAAGSTTDTVGTDPQAEPTPTDESSPEGPVMVVESQGSDLPDGTTEADLCEPLPGTDGAENADNTDNGATPGLTAEEEDLVLSVALIDETPAFAIPPSVSRTYGVVIQRGPVFSTSSGGPLDDLVADLGADSPDATGDNPANGDDAVDGSPANDPAQANHTASAPGEGDGTGPRESGAGRQPAGEAGPNGSPEDGDGHQIGQDLSNPGPDQSVAPATVAPQADPSTVSRAAPTTDTTLAPRAQIGTTGVSVVRPTTTSVVAVRPSVESAPVDAAAESTGEFASGVEVAEQIDLRRIFAQPLPTDADEELAVDLPQPFDRFGTIEFRSNRGRLGAVWVLWLVSTMTIIGLWIPGPARRSAAPSPSSIPRRRR